jgi:beta-phosphoglucomutase
MDATNPDVFRAVLFDLDGTLVDNMRYHVQAWIEMGKRFGRQLTPQYIQREFSGRKNDELFPSIAGRPLDAAEIERLAEEKEARYRELYAPHLQLVEGVDAFLGQLVERRIAVGIASAAPQKNRDFILERTGLVARIAVVVGAERVRRGKPAPDLFLEAARELGCDPRATLVFEDAVLGVQAGRAAGMTVCGVTTSEPTGALLAAGAEFTVDDFTELPAPLVARLGSASAAVSQG